VNDFEFSVYLACHIQNLWWDFWWWTPSGHLTVLFFLLEHSKLLARIRNYYFFIQITHFHSLKKKIWHANCKDYLTFFKTIVSEPAAAEIPTIKLSRSQSYFFLNRMFERGKMKRDKRRSRSRHGKISKRWKMNNKSALDDDGGHKTRPLAL
jgi:hypothetical protein